MIESKLPAVGTTIFTTISQLAAKYNAINLGQGFPDFEMPEQLIDLVSIAMKNGFNQYAHMNGYPLLRQRLAEKIFALHKNQINADENITVTPGATYGIYTAFTTILQPGDEVIVFEPAYDSYVPNILINGGRPVFISMQYPDYNIPWQEVKQKINKKTKAIIINSPHNPTGTILSEADISALRELVEETDIVIISDEVYEHLVFEGKEHLSILKYPELFKRSFVCYSFGKTYHCTGWKMGYVVAPLQLMKEFRKVHQYNAFCSNTPFQVALAEFLTEKDAYLNLGKQMEEKKNYFEEHMQPTLFKPLKSFGSYFQCYSFKSISNKNDLEFSEWLIKEYGVASIPVSSFYHDGTDNKTIRFCFAKKQQTLDAAIEKLLTVRED